MTVCDSRVTLIKRARRIAKGEATVLPDIYTCADLHCVCGISWCWPQITEAYWISRYQRHRVHLYREARRAVGHVAGKTNKSEIPTVTHVEESQRWGR